MSIDKLDYSTEVIEALQGAYRQDWCLTNWTGTGKPLLPAGMIISILGYPYIVSGGDETPTDPASDGAVYLKITPDAPAGATATAEYVNTFSGTWNEAYNGFYDGDSLFLNVFMTKATTNWTAKGTWLNFRERKLALISDGLTVEGDLIVGGDVVSVNGVFSGNLSKQGIFVDFIPSGGGVVSGNYTSGTISVPLAPMSLGEVVGYSFLSGSSKAIYTSGGEDIFYLASINNSSGALVYHGVVSGNSILLFNAGTASCIVTLKRIL